MSFIRVYCGETIGPIKKVNGVGQPPITGAAYSSMVHYLGEANIPYSRLHDVGGAFGGGMYVDIPNVFTDFSADENDPASYTFAYTDWLIEELFKYGVEPVYRLGVTIENAVARYASPRVFPPKDYEKWARVCEHVIRHYTEGWANGFRYPITYWEIWNEPENHVELKHNMMWQGSAEDYYRLYEVTARHLKACFPNIKIGGYASCGFYHITNPGGGSEPARMRYFVDFFEGFLDWITSPAHSAPLDFFSWHSYAGIEETRAHADYCRRMLDQRGFARAETQLNEWNPAPRVFGSLEHAAQVGGMLCALQDMPVDTAMFYDARVGISEYGSLFSPVTRTPYADYDAFVLFGRLLRLGGQLRVELDEPGVYAVAATDGAKRGMMAVNTNEREAALALEGVDPANLTCEITDRHRRLEKAALARDGKLHLPGWSLSWIEW